MRITKLEAYEVVVPFIPALREHMSDWTSSIVKVHTDEGIVGIGESHGSIVGQMGQYNQQVVGRDPFTFNLQELGAPFQCALYDIVGQALNLPIHKLIGDRCRDKVPVAYWSCHMPPEKTAKEAEQAAKRGFKVHKLKARSWDIVQQAELMTKAAGSEYGIRVDPNTQFRYPSEAVRLARRLESYNIECYEDPVLKDNMHWYALLRQKCDIPQALHLGRPEDVLKAVKAEAVDCVNIGGNVTGVLKCAAIAEAAGCPIWLQMGGVCLGITAAFSAHVGSVIKNATMPYDELPFIREDDLLGGSLEIKDGHITVPEGPGLGVKLDEEALKRYQTK